MRGQACEKKEDAGKRVLYVGETLSLRSWTRPSGTGRNIGEILSTSWLRGPGSEKRNYTSRPHNGKCKKRGREAVRGGRGRWFSKEPNPYQPGRGGEITPDLHKLRGGRALPTKGIGDNTTRRRPEESLKQKTKTHQRGSIRFMDV